MCAGPGQRRIIVIISPARWVGKSVTGVVPTCCLQILIADRAQTLLKRPDHLRINRFIEHAKMTK
jgi:hypothetical protein